MKVVKEHDADIILLPELNADTTLVDDILSFLRCETTTKLAIIEGQLHEQEKHNSGQYRNRPLLLVPGGNHPWPYWKMEPMLYKDQYRELLGEKPEWFAAMDSPFGRVALVVCKDLFSPDVQGRLAALHSNLVFVIAMTPAGEMEAAIEVARGIASRTSGVTIFVNSSIHLRAERAAAKRHRLLLGFLHPNSKINRHKIPSHELP